MLYDYIMPLPIIVHSLVFILTAIFTFIWASNPELSKFSFQLSGLLLIIFILNKKYRYVTNSIIITLLTLLLILDTGGLNSPLFFLANFLLFALSLFINPWAGFNLGLALCLLFLLNSDLTSTNHLTNLISLLLMAPLAFIFGNQYIKLLIARNQIKILQHQSKRLNSLISQEETSSLLWLTIDFRNQITQAIDITSQLIANLSHIPYYQKDQLNQLYLDLKKLFRSGTQLKTKIDKLTDQE